MVNRGTDKQHNFLVIILEICNRARPWTKISGVAVPDWNHSLAFLSEGTYLYSFKVRGMITLSRLTSVSSPRISLIKAYFTEQNTALI